MASVRSALERLERESGRRVGVFAGTARGQETFAYRADETFAMCSTYKGLCVAAVLSRHEHLELTRRVRYARGDMLDYSPITSKYVGHGLTVEQLCAAAMRYSDNTAGNLLLDLVGGPEAVTAFVRDIGDRRTRLDRPEPAVNTAIPGDPRDTTTPRAIGLDYLRLSVGDVLEPSSRKLFTGWLRTNTTGDAQIRAGLPDGWSVGDKTGAGDYGTTNDIAVVTPPSRATSALAVMSSTDQRGAESHPSFIAAVARIVAGVI